MLQRIEDHCNVHHELHKLGMHQLDTPEVAPMEHAVKFYNNDRQQCNVSMQAQKSPPRILRYSKLRKSDFHPDKKPDEQDFTRGKAEEERKQASIKNIVL
jgi:hypothetical protein